MKRTVFIGMPTHDARCQADVIRMIIAAMTKEECNFQTQGQSLLARNFNHLLAQALNDGRYTHFLLIHSDIIPQSTDWLTVMLDEMEKTGAEILSVVSPIKNHRGLTSTALIPRGEADPQPPIDVKRFTIKEIFDQAETFTDPDLVVNSGLMLIDLKAPWIGKVWFEIHDDVIQENGKWKPVTISEDWLFSIRARALGAKIYATRKVPLYHVGANGFPNNVVHGIDTDGWRKA